MFCSVWLKQIFRTVTLKKLCFQVALLYDTQNAISTTEHKLVGSVNMEINMELLIINSGEEPYLGGGEEKINHL